MKKLDKTWFFDLDGTLVEHAGLETRGYDSLLPNVKEVFEKIPNEDMVIITTARPESEKEKTETFLKENGIKFNLILYNLKKGKRILINDKKPSGYDCAKAISVERNIGLNYDVFVNIIEE
jgi:FMN phosphatase YigB (HAD superfamily)